MSFRCLTVTRWIVKTFGRVTLLGDAAHPMYPIGSNGASQAILDADYLTECLLKFENPLEALEAYDRERVPAAAKSSITKPRQRSRPNHGYDGRTLSRRFFEEKYRTQRFMEEVMDHYKKVAGFDVQTLNQKR